jgi:hypothetical protein
MVSKLFFYFFIYTTGVCQCLQGHEKKVTNWVYHFEFQVQLPSNVNKIRLKPGDIC